MKLFLSLTVNKQALKDFVGFLLMVENCSVFDTPLISAYYNKFFRKLASFLRFLVSRSREEILPSPSASPLLFVKRVQWPPGAQIPYAI